MCVITQHFNTLWLCAFSQHFNTLGKRLFTRHFNTLWTRELTRHFNTLWTCAFRRYINTYRINKNVLAFKRYFNTLWIDKKCTCVQTTFKYTSKSWIHKTFYFTSNHSSSNVCCMTYTVHVMCNTNCTPLQRFIDEKCSFWDVNSKCVFDTYQMYV